MPYRRYEIDPTQYAPESFGRAGANLWNNANEASEYILDLLGMGSDDVQNAKGDIDPTRAIPAAVLGLGGIEEVPVKAYLKKMAPEAQALLRSKFAEPYKQAYIKRLDEIKGQQTSLDDITDRIANAIEDKIPMTKMGELPHPDQQKYVDILRRYLIENK